MSRTWVEYYLLEIVTDGGLMREEVFCAQIFDGRQYTERELAILGCYEKEELNIMPRFSILHRRGHGDVAGDPLEKLSVRGTGL